MTKETLMQVGRASDDRGLGGLRHDKLVPRIAKSAEALRHAIRWLPHAHADSYDKATAEELGRQVVLAAEYWVNTLPGEERPSLLDVALMAVFWSEIDDELRLRLFGGVPREEDLTAPVAKWLRADGYQVAFEVPAGNSRADLVGFKKPFISRDITVVELKNAASEVKRLDEQLADYRRVADRVRVVVTPACLAEVTLESLDVFEPLAFARRVEKMGAELWLYDAYDETFERIAEGSSSYDGSAYDKFWEQLNADRAA